MWCTILPALTCACLAVAGFIPKTSGFAALRNLPGNVQSLPTFKITINLEDRVRIAVKEHPSYPKASALAAQGVVTGPKMIEVEGVEDITQVYKVQKWSDMAVGTYTDTCDVEWSWYGPSGDANLDVGPDWWRTNAVLGFTCEGLKLDPDSGPYITLEPRGYGIQFLDPEYFGDKVFSSGEQAKIKGVTYNERDNIWFNILTEPKFKCVVGTRDAKSQTKDVTFTLASLQTDNPKERIPQDVGKEDNVGIECKLPEDW